MTKAKIRAMVAIGMLLAGCSGQVAGTIQVPDLRVAPGAIQVNVDPAVLQEATRQFQLVDKDPAPDAVQAMLAKLGINVNVQVVNVVNNNGGGGGGTTNVDVDQQVTIVIPSNASEVCGVQQETPVSTTTCEVKQVTASSVRNDWFATARMRDGNPTTAWGPKTDDGAPSLTFAMSGCCTIAGMKLKISPVGVVVDVLRRTGDGPWEPVVTGLVPKYRELHTINLPPFTADEVRLNFRGAVDGTVLVCEADMLGMGCGSPVPSATPTATAAPTATPTAAPSATPTAAPSASALPSADPSATPSAEPSVEVSADPSATPTAEATATPTPEPSATATATAAP